MAKSGDVIDNPLSGEQITFTRSAADTNGERLDVTLVLGPHASGPPEHIHPIIEERFKVTSGTVNVRIGGEERTLNEGEEVTAAPGVAHTFWNDSDKEARLEGQIRPPLHLDTFLETVFGLARDGKTNKEGMPNLLQASVIMKEYSDEMQLAGVPLFAQRLLTTLVAPVGKLFGYKARYPEYSDE